MVVTIPIISLISALMVLNTLFEYGFSFLAKKVSDLTEEDPAALPLKIGLLFIYVLRWIGVYELLKMLLL
jgi:hypothetical protein